MALLLDVRLSVDYPERPGVLRDVALTLSAGETLGLIGQSGVGKSTLALAVLGLLDRRARVQGYVRFQGRDLLGLPERELRQLRGAQIATVPQSPLASLNPALRLGTQLKEAWRAHRRGPRSEEDAAIREALRRVQLPDTDAFLQLTPRQLSVGLAQRVLIGMAILHRPPLVLADEATSALDVVTQAEILDLFRELGQQEMALLYISHDLPSVAALCSRLAVLHEGQLVANGPTREVLANPPHPHVARLLAALPPHPASR